ncbi:single-stranded DNA-binding protein [Pseudomonas fluorescens]|nr:single-stranded DNA-binding protein [Pseudomonas fluorescens]
MSTKFLGEGNIGTKPEFREFSNGNKEPRRLLRLNVYFDNAVLKGDGEYEDRGGFWSSVELWHKDAERYSELYSKSMRVVVIGRLVMDKWEDESGGECKAMKVQARRVGILPHRLQSIAMKVSEPCTTDE